jgi:radical SAM superfamily enzyme YgiQ (UPF0313 family)
MIPLIAQALPATKMLIGGPHISLQWLQKGKYDSLPVHFVAVGEGEKIFANLLKNLSGSGPALEEINGLAFRESVKVPFSNGSLKAISDDFSAFPSTYRLGVIDDEVYARPSFYALVETQRGCNGRCVYCTFHRQTGGVGTKYRAPEDVMEDIRYLDSKGCYRIGLADANFGSNLKYAKEFMRMIIASDVKTWYLVLTTSPSCIDEEIASLYGEFIGKQQGNAIVVNIGLQTTNIQTLRIMRRPNNLETVIEHVNLLKKNGAFIKFDTIVGLPNDTKEDVERTIEFCCELFSDSNAHTFQPHILEILPGSDLEDMQQEYGLIARAPLVGSNTLGTPQIYETKTIRREEFVEVLRKVAVAYRLINGKGWARWRSFNRPERTPRLYSTELRDTFFRIKNEQGISCIQIINMIIERLMNESPKNSLFRQPDFPLADIWWMAKGYNEFSDDWMLEVCKDILKTTKIVPA